MSVFLYRSLVYGGVVLYQTLPVPSLKHFTQPYRISHSPKTSGLLCMTLASHAKVGPKLMVRWELHQVGKDQTLNCLILKPIIMLARFILKIGALVAFPLRSSLPSTKQFYCRLLTLQM